MGVSVMEIKSGPDKGKFILTNSIDNHSTGPISRAEAVLLLHNRELCDMQLKFIENWLSFPNGWGDGHCRRIGDNEAGRQQWRDWLSKTLQDSEDDDAYEAAIRIKYDECMALAKKESEAEDPR